MKFKLSLLIIVLVLCNQNLSAQSPMKFSYQAIIRGSTNGLVINSPVGVQISLLQGTPSGNAVFVERHTVMSNANGLVSLEIGGGNVLIGSLSQINWGNGPYFLRLETDPAGGTSYSINGTTQLLSVPYALYAESSGTPSPWQSSGNNVFLAGSNVGINTIAPQFPLQLNGHLYINNRAQRIIFGSGIGAPDSIHAIYRPLNSDGLVMESNDINIKSRVTPLQLMAASSVQVMDLNGVSRLNINTVNGNVGIGSAPNTSRLTASGIIESSTGGFRFPDGTTQTTASNFWQASGTSIQYSTGNVGIGVTTPISRLHLNGDLRFSTRGQKILFLDSSVFIERPTATDGLSLRGNDIYIRSAVTPIQLQSNNSVNFMDLNGVTRFLVNTQSGNIGVGTTSPSMRLHVVGDQRLDGNLGIGVPNPTVRVHVDGDIRLNNRGQKISFLDNNVFIERPISSDGLMLSAFDIYVRSTVTALQLQSATSVNLMDLNGNSRMVVNTQNGNVGIGTTIPARTLHVNAVMRLEPLATAPTGAVKGDMYFDGTLNKLRVFDGTVWQNCW